LVGILYNQWILIVAVWNIIACYQNNKLLAKIKSRPVGIYEHYERSLTSEVIVFIANIIGGAIIGIVGVIYDLYTRQYAMRHKEILLFMENQIVNNEKFQN